MHAKGKSSITLPVLMFTTIAAWLATQPKRRRPARSRSAIPLIMDCLEPRVQLTTGFIGNEGFSQVYDYTLFKTLSHYSAASFALGGLQPGDDVSVRLDLSVGPIPPGPTTFAAGRYREADLISITGGSSERTFTTGATSETVTTVARNYDVDDFARARISVRNQPDLQAVRLGYRPDGGGVEFVVKSTRNFLPQDVSVVLSYEDELGNSVGVAWAGKLGRGTPRDVEALFSIPFSWLAKPGRGPDGRGAVRLVGTVNPEGFPEPFRDNNKSVLTLPDLRVINAELSSPTKLSVDYTLSGSLPRAMPIVVVRSSDFTFDPGDERVASGSTRPAGNTSGRATIDLDRVPQVTSAKPYLLVVANPDGVAYEGAPDNNVSRLRSLTLNQLRSIMVSNPDPARWLVPLANAMLEFGIVTPAQQAAFLANDAQETTDLRDVREGDYLNPKTEAARIAALKPLYTTRPDIINPVANGPHWYGRGPLQLTSRKNYEAASSALFGNKNTLAANPDLVASDLTISARASAWFWSSRRRQKDNATMNELADRLTADDFRSITVLINGIGSSEAGASYPNGWDERVKSYRRALQTQFLGVLPGETAVRVGGWNLPSWVPSQTSTQRLNGLDLYLTPFRRTPVATRTSIWLSNGVERRIVMGGV